MNNKVISKKNGVQNNNSKIIIKKFTKPATIVSLGLLFISIFCAVLAPFLAPTNPYDLKVVSILDSRLSPGDSMFNGNVAWLGTDGAGRDVLSAIIYGLRTSLIVAICSALIALTIGLIALVLLALLGKGIDKVIIALAIVQWAIYARTVRAAAIVERNKEYIQAASCLGLSNSLIIWKHLLPNSISPLIVLATLQTAHSISIEATLSFLGVGVPITEPSLGSLISNGFDFILSGAYWITFFPGLMLLATVAAINIFGDQLRIILNPRVNR